MPVSFAVLFHWKCLAAHQMQERGMAFETLDNAFLQIANYGIANQLVTEFEVKPLTTGGWTSWRSSIARWSQI